MARVTTGDVSGRRRAPRAADTGAMSATSPPPLRRAGQQTPDGIVIVAASAIIVVAVFLFEITSYFAIRPGPAPDVTQLIEITGAKTKPVTGHLLLTTVSLQEITVAEAIRSWFDPNFEVVPRSALVPAGGTEEDAHRRTTQQMDESQEHAAAAALSFLGYDVKVTPVGARVVGVVTGGPAAKVLRRDDVIVAADTTPVHKHEELRSALARHKVGDVVALRVRRGSAQVTVKMKTVGDPEEPTQPIIGVFLETVPRVTLPVAVDIESLGIGGPSAGLMYALGIVELLDSSDITKKRTIAGTGAISISGVVEPVGGVRQKVAAARGAGAEVFLVPLVELREACARAGDLPVIGVQTLKDAVAALRTGRVPAARTCSR